MNKGLNNELGDTVAKQAEASSQRGRTVMNRRDVIRIAILSAPAVLLLTARPAHAQEGSAGSAASGTG